MEKALFAAGCFWGVEASFKKFPGVIKTCVGYTGGHVENPTYHQVCAGDTGHAEAVLVEFDPKIVSFDQLLDQFWQIHNPTTLNRQGPDVGHQYRSAIFFFTQEQEQQARKSKERQKGAVTEITPAGPFWRAEDYHQCYLEKRFT